MSGLERPLVRIVDDDPSLRESLAFMLECEGYEVKSYPSAWDFLTNDMPSRTGCLILDVKMPEMTGLELQRELNQRGFEVPIVFLTGHGDIEMAVQTMRDGACDFYQKPIVPEVFLPAVARAIEKDRERRGGASDILDEVRRFESLTPREEEICRAIAKGLITRVIAERLGISKRTADHLRTSALKKVGLRTAAELSGFFLRIDDEMKKRSQ